MCLSTMRAAQRILTPVSYTHLDVYKRQEKSGEPPIPNKFAKAVMMVRMGKVMPTPVRASAPTPGICPRYIRSTTL